MRLPKHVGCDVTFKANVADACNLSRIAETVRDRLGSPFLDWGTALRMSLDITRRVIEAGEIERFRAVPITVSAADLLFPAAALPNHARRAAT